MIAPETARSRGSMWFPAAVLGAVLFVCAWAPAPASATSTIPRAPVVPQVAEATAEMTVATRRYHRRGRYRTRFIAPRFSFYSGFYGWGGWGAPFWGGWGPYGWGYDGWGYFRPDAGAVDLDIKPEKAKIYLDGDYIGVADNYDGFPRYLWLKPGTYEMVIYKEGFETLKRRLKVVAGEVIDMNDRMVPGESTSPEEIYGEEDVSHDVAPPRTLNQTMRERSERPRIPAPVRRSREPGDEVQRGAEPRGELDRVRSAGPRVDQRGEPGRLELVVSPIDAVVYLDGRLLGSGAELARLHSAMLVDPGSHTLEVTRPGYETKTLEFEVEPGELVELDAKLQEP